MRLVRSTSVIAVSLLLLCASRSWGLVPGRSKKSGCLAEWKITTAGVSGPRVSCADGDPTCDADGTPDGQCTFAASVCAFQSNVSTCTPTAVESFSFKGKAKKYGFQTPATPVSAAACSDTPTDVVARLRVTRKGIHKASKPIKLIVAATTSGTPRMGSALVTLVCLPSHGDGTTCPANPSGPTEPNEVRFTVAGAGTDLDNGWTGATMNFPTPQNTKFQLCLSGCDSTTKHLCTATLLTGPDTFNKTSLGPPLPLFAASLPVCVVNEYAPQQEQGTADLLTGEVSGPIHLLSHVYLTDEVHVCPRCETGTCDSGPRQGQSCGLDGEVTVTEAQTSNKHFRLSKDCPPPTDLLAGTLVLDLPLSTGTSTLAPLTGGSAATPCVAQAGEPQGLRPKTDNCAAGTCTATCTGNACVSMGQDYTTGAPVCIDSKGGLSQFCCSSRTDTPCQPTSAGSGGAITRVGRPEAPQPLWPDPTYPKKTACDTPGQCLVAVATFCEPATGTNSVDTLTGLPGPGAMIIPSTTEWLAPSR